jgi:hypothetical protein
MSRYGSSTCLLRAWLSYPSRLRWFCLGVLLLAAIVVGSIISSRASGEAMLHGRVAGGGKTISRHGFSSFLQNLPLDHQGLGTLSSAALPETEYEPTVSNGTEWLRRNSYRAFTGSRRGQSEAELGSAM